MTQMTDSEPEPLLYSAAEIRAGTLRLARRLRSERPADALSTNKISILALLHRRGPSTPGDLAAADRQRPQSLTRIFAELEADGLIARSRSEQDRRESVLTLTEAGRAALYHDMYNRDRWLAGALAGLSETEINVLRMAGRLMERLADATPSRSLESEESPA
jgi:DNA-binding MarR family transcriptional regulator